MIIIKHTAYTCLRYN